MGGVLGFYTVILQLALVLSAMGVLKEATLAMAGRALRTQQGIIS